MSSSRRCLCWFFLVILCSIKATSGLSTGAIVGIVVGIGGTTVLVFIALVVLVLLVVILKRKRNTKSNNDTGLNDTPPDTALQELPLSPGLEDNIAYGSATTDSAVMNTSTNVAYGQNETTITASSAYDTVRFSN